ncbi:hypothetical protein Bca52824_069975 [Brassica carinata]|uniref:Formin-like protein n=1 Tax=Brassica carinata TaxID=52824 RepID=A0A8X7U4N0_BRACI|nr:hypothetical protein Bca52824_069975 [Brassica carinata]
MSLFRKYFNKKSPDRLVEISERVYAFDCCFSSDVMGEDEYKSYFGGIVAQLHDHYPDASFMVCNFRAGDQPSRISTLLSQYGMSVMDYPNQHESVPLLPLQVISQFLISSESWLGQQNVLLMHCERGSLPLLDFMLSALLLYNKRYHGDQKTLELAYNQASKELAGLSSALNPLPSQLRYLRYISTRDLGSDWPPSEVPLHLDCLILRGLSNFEWRKDWRPSLRVFGQDPEARTNRSSILFFSTPKTNTLYQQEECIQVKLDIQCLVQGDIVLEFINLHDDLVCEEVVFRIMFHTAFVRGNVLMVQRDEMNVLWDAEDQFPKEFKAEVLFSDADAKVPVTVTTSPMHERAPHPMRRAPPPLFGAPEFDMSEIETLFSAKVQKQADISGNLPINLKKAHNVEIFLWRAKMPLHDIMAAVLAMDESIVNVNQIGNLIKSCPTKEEMELLKDYRGDKAILGNCEQYFLELMKVPRVESKLRVLSFKVHFGTQVRWYYLFYLFSSLLVHQIRSSQKLKEIMERIPYLGNTNQVPARDKTIPLLAVGFELKNLSKLSHTRGANSMQYLCKDLASKASNLLDFHKDLESLESASKIQLTLLAEDMQAILNGLNILNQELTASESDGPASEVFHKLLKELISIAETEVASVSSLYSVAGKNVDAIVHYVGEDPKHCPFEQVTEALVDFIRLFKKAHEENIKQSEWEKKEAAEDKRVKKAQGLLLTRKVFDPARADNLEIMLWRVRMPLPDMMDAVQAMDDTVLDNDQIENLIRFCPTKEEMELLNKYTGDKERLGEREQYFLELMKVPRVESKLRVFSFKIQFSTQITELRKSLEVVKSACQEVRTSQKLREVLKMILYLGNTLNQGTVRGAAVGFKVDSLLILSDTRAADRKMTLMHYLCKVIASKASDLLDFHKDLESLETASKIQLKSLAEEMQAISKGLEMLDKELTASERDGHVSEVFSKRLKDFMHIAETEERAVIRLYTETGKNADSLSYYFGEDPSRYPFEQAFDCCFSCDVMGDDEYKLYLDGIVAQLHDHYPDASFMVCNFRAGYQRSRISTLLSQYRMWVMDYPNQQGSVPVLPLQVISQFLISREK